MDKIKEDVSINISNNVKEQIIEIILDERGSGLGKVEINGYLEFIQFRKQFNSLGTPNVLVLSEKLVEPILETVLEDSAIYPVRFLCTDPFGDPRNILNYEHTKLPLNDVVEVEITCGTPRSKIEVLIRYA